MKEETRPVFVADDGTVFEKAEDALAHEEKLREQKAALSRLRVVRVVHGFDATEGRGYFAQTVIVTDATSAVITQWCLNKFGSPLQSWFGDSYYDSWYLTAPSPNETVEWGPQP